MATHIKTGAVDGNLETEICDDADGGQAGNSSKIVRTSRKAHPVDHGWAWAVMIGSFGVHFLSFGFIRSFGILFLEFQAKFEASSAMTAVVVGVQFCVYSISTFLVVNVVLKRFSVRQSCLLGCCLQSLGILLNGVVPDITYLLLTQGILFGVGLALIYCPALILISQYFETKRAISTAIAASGVSAGGVTLPFLMRYFVENYGLRGGLLLLAAVMFNQAVFVSLFTPPSQYTFVESGKLNNGPEKQYNRTTQDAKDESEELDTGEKEAGIKTHLGGKTSLQDNNSYQNREESLGLLPKYSRDGFGNDEESILLLQQISNGSQKSTQPVRLNGIVVSGDRDMEETVREGSSDGQHRETTTSVHDRKNEEDVECSSQLQSLLNNSPNPKQSKLGVSDQNETKQFVEHGNKLSLHDIYLLQRDPLQAQSLRDTVLQVLSTSGTDLCGSLLDVSSKTIVPFGRNQSAPDTSNTQVDFGKSTKRTNRWRCHLPPVVKTIHFWVLLVFFACGGIGSGLPPIFLPPLVKEKDMNDKVSFLLMMSAVTEVIGRLLPGVILHFGIMGPCSVLIVPLAAAGTLYQFTALYNDFGSLLAMALLMGLFTGSFWTMQSLVVIDIFGLERLGPMLGFYVLIVGLNLGVWNPFSGLLRDVSGSYSVTFHFFGIAYYVAALMMVLVLVLKRISNKKRPGVASSDQNIPLRSPLDTV